jgi:hypothetical protein
MTARRRALWTAAIAPWLVAAAVWSVIQVAHSPGPAGVDHAEPEPTTVARPARALGDVDDRGGRPAPTRVASIDPKWVAILGQLDRRRELAYALGDPRRLRSVYVADSPVLRHDVAMLRAYRTRGVSLTGVRLRVIDADLMGRDGRYVRLRVVDRLERPTAHTEHGSIRLPRDEATARVIVLRDIAVGWRIAAVREV